MLGESLRRVAESALRIIEADTAAWKVETLAALTVDIE